MHCAQHHYNISYISLKRQNKITKTTPKKKINIFHIHTIYYKTSMKSSAMVYIKIQYMPSLSWQIEMPVTNFCHQNLRPEAKPPEASTQVGGVWSVHGVLRHSDLEKSAFSNHWWITGIFVHFLIHHTNANHQRWSSECNKSTEEVLKNWYDT